MRVQLTNQIDRPYLGSLSHLKEIRLLLEQSDYQHNICCRRMPDYENYLIVEETTTRFTSIVYKGWMIEDEKAYWHPGCKSDYQYMDVLRHRTAVNTTEIQIEDKKIRLKWQKVRYNEILFQSSKYTDIITSRPTHNTRSKAKFLLHH